MEKDPGDWWAVASDVASALEYRMASDTTRNIEPEDKDTHKVRTPGGEQDMTVVSEFGVYDAVFGSKKPEAKEFKRWVKSILKALRQSSGLEAFQVFRMLDKEHQKAAMQRLRDGISKPVRVDFIKANTVANKAVSTLYGHPKMLKKEQMTSDMLIAREPILDDTVIALAAKDSLGLDISISKVIYGKYCSG